MSDSVIKIGEVAYVIYADYKVRKRIVYQIQGPYVVTDLGAYPEELVYGTQEAAENAARKMEEQQWFGLKS